jgi:hypothetical protein
MNLRAVMISLAAVGLLSSLAPLSAQAQGHPRGAGGGGRFAQGDGGRGRDGGRNYGGYGQPPGGRGGWGGGWPGGWFGGGYGRGGSGGGEPGDGRGYGGYGGGEPYGGRGGPPAYPVRPYPPAGAGYGRPFGGGDWRNQQNEVRQAVREGRHIPLGRAIDAVRQRSPGRELDAGLETGPGGRTLYRVRWAASDGRRIDYLVDAATGAIISTQGGR